MSVAAVVLPIEKGIFEGLFEAESSSSLPNSSGTGAASVSNPNPGAFLLTIRSVVCVQTVPILAWLLDTTPPARPRCNLFVSRPGTDTFFVCASPLLCAASFLHRQEPRASGGDGGRLGHDQVHHGGPAEPIGVAGRPLDSLPSVTTLNLPLLCSPALCPCRPSPCGSCRPPWPFPGAASAPTGRVRACCMARLIFSAVSEVSDFFVSGAVSEGSRRPSRRRGCRGVPMMSGW